MLAPSSSSPAKMPTLSYADRAKKAQHIRSPNSAFVQRTTMAPQSPMVPATIQSSSSSASTSSQTSVSNILSVSSATSAGLQPSPPPSPPPHPKPTIQPNTVRPTQNGNTQPQELQPVLTPVSSPQKPIVLNVWEQRKEQMANRGTMAPGRPSALAPSNPSHSSISPSQSNPLTTAARIPVVPVSVSASALTNVIPNLPPPSTEDDPFVVRPTNRPPPLPPSRDTEAWPEIGKSAPPTAVPHPVTTSASQDGISQSQSATTTPRKNEKPKWVSIPAEELQAAADANRDRSRSHSRNHSQQRLHAPPSGHNSGRTSHSHSTNQSRIQSRTGSAQSSPRFSRNKQLPTSSPQVISPSALGSNISLPPRSSRSGSPLHQSKQLSTPPHHPPPSALTFGEHPPSLLYGVANIQATQPIAQPNFYHHSPRHSQHHASSPTSPSPVPKSLAQAPPFQQADIPLPHPYPPLPHYPLQPPPTHMHNYGAPTYPMYPYEYPQALPPPPPFMYWNPNPLHPGSEHSTPPYPAPVPIEAYLALPPPEPFSNAVNGSGNGVNGTGSVKPPPPEESQPVAGYKTLGAASGSSGVVFGSIGLQDVDPSLSPALALGQGESRDAIEAFTALAIGVRPGDEDWLRHRGRTRTLSELTNGIEKPAPVSLSNRATTDDGEKRVWVFGTTEEDEQQEAPAEAPVLQLDVAQFDLDPSVSSYHQTPLALRPVVTDPYSTSIPPRYGPALSPIDMPVPNPGEFEIRDYGYGFGSASGTGYAVALSREEAIAREHERLREDRERDDRDRDRDNVRPPPPRGEPEYSLPPRSGRQGYYNGGYPYARGGYPARRGRGGRGRGDGRHVNRERANSGRQPYYGTESASNFFPPHHMATYIPTGFEGYPPRNVPPATAATAANPGPAGSPIAPPVPVPQSMLSFPLDPTRYYLLGQLEYYLSTQNMAQDVYLKKQMDSKGWIPIEVLASFPRVKRLTLDTQLVRDVLTLSSVVQVFGKWVRMNNWEQFVFPDAAESQVDGIMSNAALHSPPTMVVGPAHTTDPSPDTIGEEGLDEEEEEEEEVEFVMGNEAGGWTPERRS